MDALFDDILKTKPYPEGQPPDDTSFFSSVATTAAYQNLPDFPETDLSHIDIPEPVDGRTIPYPAIDAEKKRTTTHHLGIGDKLELNSLKYEITGMISEEGKSGEAIIYKVKNEQGSVYALKLYYEFTDEHLEPSADTLQRIREIKGNDILHLFDFGTGPNKYLNKFCFEISDFAAGGDLLHVNNLKEKYSITFLENVVIAGIFRGIKALHREKIYHCDLKPQNVFFLDQAQTQVVIGDYGSAKSREKSSEKELSHTTITKGTEFYLAPEQAFGIVSEKNDYYSLGMIVLHLFYPENVSRKNLRRIFERRTKGVQIIDFDSKYEHLNQLIEGLTLQDYNNRWGEEEITRWLAGRDVSVNYASYGNRNFIKIGQSILRTSKDVVGFIEAGNPFYEELIEDKEGYNTLLTWISQAQGDENRGIFDKMISYYKRFYGIDYVREAILFYFAPLRNISVGLVKFDFNNVSKLTENIRAFVALMDDLWKITDFATLRFYFFQFEFAVHQLRVKSPEPVKHIIDDAFAKIARIIGAEYHPDFTEYRAELYIALRNEHLINIFYAFNQGRYFRDSSKIQYNSLLEVCQYFEGHPRVYGDAFMLLERQGFFMQNSREQLLAFIRKNENCLHFLFRQKDDFELMANVLGNHLKDQFTYDFLHELLIYYHQLGLDVLKIVLIRLLDPESPVVVGEARIFLFQKGTLLIKVRDFLGALDKLWKTAPLEDVAIKFFEFEFTLLQLANNDRIALKTMISPVFDKISKVLRGAEHDILKLRSESFKQITDENIIEIFYLFNPHRAFCDDALVSHQTLEETGLYFLQNSEKYNQKIPAIERESFLNHYNFHAYQGLHFDDFILKVFRTHATIETRVINFIFDEPAVGEATIEYTFTISINDYLKSKGDEGMFEISPQKPENVIIKKGPFDKDEALLERFASQILHKHRIVGKTLAGVSAESFQKALESKKELEYFHGYTFIPRYLLFLFPIFGMIYFCANYLVDYSVFKQIGFSISPSLNMVSVRMARSYYSIVLFAGYSLNFLTGIFLLVPLLSLRRDGGIFREFLEYHGVLINRMMRFFILGPILFVAIYFLIDQFLLEVFMIEKKSGLAITSERFAIFMYLFFLTQHLLKVVIAFFQTYKKFRILPLIIAISIYVVLGFFTIAWQNLWKTSDNIGKIEKSIYKNPLSDKSNLEAKVWNHQP